MSAVLKLLLGSVVVLQVLQGSALEFNNYADLPEDYRTHIDKALDDANSKLGGPYHVVYESLLSSPTIESTHWHVNVLLMVTECKKDPLKRHRAECVKKKPNAHRIDCLVCKKEGDDELIDCVRRKDFKSRKEIRSRCQYYVGGQILMSKSENAETTFGCTGCV